MFTKFSDSRWETWMKDGHVVYGEMNSVFISGSRDNGGGGQTNESVPGRIVS